MSDKIYRLGCDIGGTFTDFVLLDDETGEIQINKILTTPRDPSDAVEEGIKKMQRRNPGFVERLSEVIHGTTLVINSIIERKGARTGLITTKGFRDTLEFGREMRYDMYDIFALYPEPLVSRPFRREVDERISSDGRIIRKLDPGEVKAVLHKLMEMGIESLAVCLLNSFENPAHELLIKDIVLKEAPELSISISYEVLPQIREYERTSTTVANAYVKPLTGSYIARLSKRLDSLGSTGKLFIMLSSGGITSAETAAEFPVRVIESGPTAAVTAAEYYGKMFNVKDIFAFDMGGTTAKSCLIQKGKAGVVSTFEVGRVHRFKKGSGLPIQVPVVDLMEIGAGGGSIASISKMGLLQVGPQSAGADPGPVCYGSGGVEPTVTDADLCLGYLDPNYFLGGTMKLDKGIAERAIDEKVAEPLGVSSIAATWPLAGVGSALGFFTAPIAFEMVRSHKVGLRDADFAEIENLFQEMEAEGANTIQKAGTIENIMYERSIDMRFIGQGFEVNVPVPNGDFSRLTKDDIHGYYDARYEVLYGRTFDAPLEFVSFRVNARLSERPLQLPKIEKNVASLKDTIKGRRQAYSPIARDFIPYTVYDRYSLFPGATLDGPAIVEEMESTTIVGEDASVSADDYGFLWINLKEV